MLGILRLPELALGALGTWALIGQEWIIALVLWALAALALLARRALIRRLAAKHIRQRLAQMPPPTNSDEQLAQNLVKGVAEINLQFLEGKWSPPSRTERSEPSHPKEHH